MCIVYILFQENLLRSYHYFVPRRLKSSYVSFLNISIYILQMIQVKTHTAFKWTYLWPIVSDMGSNRLRFHA